MVEKRKEYDVRLKGFIWSMETRASSVCVLFAQEIALQIKLRLSFILFCQGCRRLGPS